MRRIILNRKYIVKLATRWTTGIFAFLGLIGTFASLRFVRFFFIYTVSNWN